MTSLERFLSGIDILRHYKGAAMSAAHDIVYFGPSDPTSVSEEDVAKLEAMNWFIESESGYWAFFV